MILSFFLFPCNFFQIINSIPPFNPSIPFFLVVLCHSLLWRLIKIQQPKLIAMKKLLLVLFACLWVLFSEAQQPIVIKGKIDNCTNRSSAYIRNYWYNPKTLKEESNFTDFKIENDGAFYVKIKEPNNCFLKYWIHLGNEETHMELIAGDSLEMTLNAAMFDESIQYKGRGAGRNNYRRDVFLQFWDTNSMGKINSNDPSQFLSSLSNLRERKLDLLNKYYLSKEIDSSYYRYEKALIMNEMANLILVNNRSYHHHHHLPDSLARKMTAVLKTADFSDDHFLNYKEFRELVAGLPAYMTQLDPIKPGVDLNREIQYGQAHYTNAMQLYFDRELILKYFKRAQSISEKHALLNYFDHHFDAPILKNEILLQRNQLQNHRIGNSMIFQASLISIAMLVGLVLFLFIIIKLIQFSADKRMNINLSLWLRVFFYLGVAFASLVFIANNHAPLHGIPSILLLIGTFLIHTYVLIPKYAIKKDPHYYMLSGAALFLFLAGNLISKQESGSLFSILGLGNIFFALLLLSWTSYYINQLASRKYTLKELVKSGQLNLELAFNLVALFLINSLFVINVSHSARLNPVLLFYVLLTLLYFHAFVSYPRFFNKEKALRFIGIQVLILLGASVAMIFLDAVQSAHALKSIGVATQMAGLISVRNVRPDLLLVLSLLLIPSFIYYFTRKQLISNESTGFKLYRKKEAELAQLKSQVNPHFLFNTLNTLYAFALKEGSDKTAECIAKLANLMRFMLDDMEKDSILMKREISHIKD